MGRWNRKEFTSNGTWTAPAGVKLALILGIGGGGGGGKGLAGTTSTSLLPGGGGGGGAAIESLRYAKVTPGTTYNITVGTAGAGATSPGTAGAVGGASIFYETIPTDNLASFTPAHGGGAGQDGATLGAAHGGLPVSTSNSNGEHDQPGRGGFGDFSGNAGQGGIGRRGPSSRVVSAGGGTTFGLVGSVHGGGGGGAGGVGIETSTAASGGNGGTATSPGTGSAGSAGTAAGGFGGGGGGGGGGGCGTVAGGAGGNGANGTPGRIVVMWRE